MCVFMSLVCKVKTRDSRAAGYEAAFCSVLTARKDSWDRMNQNSLPVPCSSLVLFSFIVFQIKCIIRETLV